MCQSLCCRSSNIFFIAVYKRGVCKHQLSFHDQDFQKTGFCRPFFAPRTQLSEKKMNIISVLLTQICHILCKNKTRKQRQTSPAWTSSTWCLPDSPHFWAKLLGDKGNAGGRWTSDGQGSAHWWTPLLYPNPADRCTGVISKLTIWGVYQLTSLKT